VAVSVQFSWPRACSYLAARVQIPMSAVTSAWPARMASARDHISCSRWPEMSLPEIVGPSPAAGRIVARDGLYDYGPLGIERAREWRGWRTPPEF
jgi:hypothetical protein